MDRKGLSDYTYIPEINISSFADNKSLVVQVTDNGTGIDEEHINKIMLPFYSTKEEGKGTGLGLSISYEIIRDMGGKIEIESTKMTKTDIRLIFNINQTQDGK